MVNLLLAIHCHQPVGNFDKVFVEAFSKAYLPFVKVLEKHPKIKLALHYSGSLLDWLCSNRSEFIDKLRGLVKKGQIEIFAGGYYEPILSLIPENDALAQIELLKLKVKELFSFEAKGAWITERVWEPKLPKILSKAGIEYGVIDDSQFRYIGKDPESLSGFYLTEEEGFKFNIFPGSEKFRYLWPFKLPQETIDYLRSRENNNVGKVSIAFADDGEKFGLWPGTYKWVYQENWLDNFFKTLEENYSWINLVTFRDYIANNEPTDRVYLPCASYREMMEWSEGFYRNFMVRYPEVNNMHKKMFYVSNKINSIESKLKTKGRNLLKQAKRHLYMSQANDSYWHGVFGGIYLNHLRDAVYHHLIETEKIIDNLKGKSAEDKLKQLDFDCDGKDELLVNTRYFNLCFRSELGASLSGWDYKPKAFNLVNTLARRPEPYHQKIKELIAQKDKLKNLNSDNSIASIHDFTQVKEEGLEELLFYDRNPRYCLLDHFLGKEVGLTDFICQRYKENGDFIGRSYAFENKSSGKEMMVRFSRQAKVNENLVNLSKTIKTKNSALILDYFLEPSDSKRNLEAIFGIEFNLSSFDKDYAKPGELKGITKFILNDSRNSAQIEFVLKQKANLWYFPVETVSDSETGIEKSSQGLCLLFWGKLNLAPEDNWQQNFEISISV